MASTTAVSRHPRMQSWLLLIDGEYRTWLEDGDIVCSIPCVGGELVPEDLRRCIEFLSEGDYLDISNETRDRPQDKLNSLIGPILETRIPPTPVYIGNVFVGTAHTYKGAFNMMGADETEEMLPYTIECVYGWRGLEPAKITFQNNSLYISD